MRYFLLILLVFVAGYKAWQISNPKVFTEGIGFIVMWAILLVAGVIIVNFLMPERKS